MSRKSLMGVIFTLTLAIGAVLPAGAHGKELVFGAIAIGKVSETRKSLTPLLEYLEKKTGEKIRFETGTDYMDTIARFQSGQFDFGFIGPSPYVIATSGEKGKDVFQIIAGLESNHKPYFQAAIIAAKNNDAIQSLADLKGKRFAFGSRQSTLSCYMPAKMLMDTGVFDTLQEYHFLGKHDKVVRDVFMGGYDGGGVQEVVARAESDRVKIVALSDPVYDFLIVAHHGMDQDLVRRLTSALIELKDPAILTSINADVTGFIPTSDANYDGLRQVMKEVDRRLPLP